MTTESLFGESLLPHTEIQFGAFARQRLRPMTGARARSSEIRQAYLEWAAARGGGTISFHNMRRSLEAKGYRHLQSNGVWYLDVELLPATSPPPDHAAGVESSELHREVLSMLSERDFRERARAREMLRAIDQSIAQLETLRGILRKAAR